MIALEWLAMGLVTLAVVPVLAGLYQFLLVAFSVLSTHLEKVAPSLPQISILIPAWNEDAVIGTTLDRLMRLDYPPDRLRVYVVDDASTDRTPAIVQAKALQYAGRVFHIRRENGGEGKAHTLNYGLRELWESEWTEAVLIMDADVIYTADSLLRMSRHLADKKVGAVTAYIKEGSECPNYLQRFIGFEYITATGASRRAQNVLGFLACLSGGAQLHSRENLLAIGGQIFCETLAEDTFTTFRTQLEGRRAIFEPNAIVYAEEPDSLDGLWKQRLRWARGNVQVTGTFRSLWFNRRQYLTLGSFSMGLLWFSIFLMPLFQIGATVGLCSLYFLDAHLAWQFFRGFWIIAGVVYVAVTLASCVVDPESARRCWCEGILFPGVGALGVILYSLAPFAGPLEGRQLAHLLGPIGAHTAVLLVYSWPVLSMVLSWLAKELERRRPRLRLGAITILYVAGYGPFLSAVTFAAYVKELLRAEMKWDKTIKTGKVR